MLPVTLHATIRSSMTANMHLIGERYFMNRYRNRALNPAYPASPLVHINEKK